MDVLAQLQALLGQQAPDPRIAAMERMAAMQRNNMADPSMPRMAAPTRGQMPNPQPNTGVSGHSGVQNPHRDQWYDEQY